MKTSPIPPPPCRSATGWRALALATLALLPFSLGRAEEWRLTYTLSRDQLIQDPQGASATRQEHQSSTLMVALGRQYLVCDDGHQKRVYDFAHRRMRQLDLDKHEYDDWSLYCIIGSLVSELQNRFAIGAGLRAAKIAGPAGMFDRFDNETDLRIAIPGMKQDEPEPVIDRRDLPGGGWDFRHEGTSVVRFVPAATAVPEAFHPRLASFLAYECSLHPIIRRQLVAAGRIPQELEVQWREGNRQITAHYRLQTAVPVEADSSVLPEGFRPTRHRGEPAEALFHVVALAQGSAGGPHRATREEALQFAREAIAAKRPLDALLALVEIGLQTGTSPTEEIRQDKPDFDRDVACQRYLASHDQSNAKACRKSLASCESIDRTHLQKAYMLDLLRADLLQQLSRGGGGTASPAGANPIGSAEELFLKVLAANPFLAGAYHDLGVLYYDTYRHNLAWVCFDTGRQLSPEHYLLTEITALEQKFARDFPDFF